MSRVLDRTNKKMFAFNYHSNSDDFKNLGNLHREKRVVEFFPQDEKCTFSTKPQIKTVEPAHAAMDSVSNAASTRKNLVGDDLRKNRIDADMSNLEMMITKKMRDGTQRGSDMRSEVTVSSQFPKTTNQDFHNIDPFVKAFTSGRRPDK